MEDFKKYVDKLTNWKIPGTDGGGNSSGAGKIINPFAGTPLGKVTDPLDIGSRFGSTGISRVGYASVGAIVPMTPRGSDIYPHMLAQDEAVINARSARANPALVGRLQNSAGPISDGGGVNTLVIRGEDDFGKLIEKMLVRGANLGLLPNIRIVGSGA
jgi:hypothetical protein